MTLPLKGLFAALATVTIWAVFLVGTRFAVSTNFTVEEVLLLRLGTGFLITIPLMLKLGVVPYGQSVTGAIMLGLGASALFPYIISMGLFFAPASDAGVLAPGMLPFWTAIVMVFMTGERPSRPRYIGLIVIFIGALMVGLWQVIHSSVDGAWRGHILFLSGSFLWAIYAVYFKQSGFTPLHGLVIGLFWGTLAVAPSLALSGNVSFVEVSLHDFLVMAVLQGILIAVLALVLYSIAVRQLGAAQTAAFGALTPVLALIGGALFLGETVTLIKLTGVILVATGVILASGLFDSRA